MRFLVAHQGGEILSEPLRILVHVSVDAQFEPRLLRLEFRVGSILYPDANRRLPVIIRISQPALDAIDFAHIGSISVRMPSSAAFIPFRFQVKGRSGMISLLEERNRVCILLRLED